MSRCGFALDTNGWPRVSALLFPTVPPRARKGLHQSAAAQLANPARLKAELKIAETQIKDVEFGQVAYLDTRNGIIPGKVARIDPAAQQETFMIDVTLEEPLPRGARTLEFAGDPQNTILRYSRLKGCATTKARAANTC